MSMFSIYSAGLVTIGPRLAIYLLQRDKKSLQREMRRIELIGYIAVLLTAIVLIAFQRPVVAMILPGSSIQLHTSTITAFALLYLLRARCDLQAIVLLVGGNANVVSRFIPCQALIACVLMPVLAPIFGAPGVAWAVVISFVSTAVWILPRRLSQIVGSKPHGVGL
jgi:O-antigen/teichoic acid export membrane protein